MKLSTLAKIINGTLKGHDADYQHILTDSRAIQKGDCFFAIKGEFFDGHAFIEDVASKGAAVAVVDRTYKTTLPTIHVADTRKALMALALFYRESVHIPVIGITGSCGKTTTRALLESILKNAGRVLASQKSFNNDIGLPTTLIQLRPEHDFAVLEIGTNHPGEIAALTAIAKPTISVITMAAAVHVEGFGSVKKIAAEKGEIYAGLTPDGTAIINVDDDYADYWKGVAGDRRVITFGQTHQADIMAHDIKVTANGKTRFTLQLPNQRIVIELPLLGEHNVVNALSAAAVAYALHIRIEKIKIGLETAQPEYGRLNIKKGLNGATIIDDSYNANPTSVVAAIKVLTHRSDNAILVLGDMKELGEIAESMHQYVGENALQHGVKKLFCYGKNSALAAKAFGDNAYHFDDQQALIEALKPYLSKTVTVLVKGSLSMKMVNIVNAIITG